MSLVLKQMLVGTATGRAAMAFRDKLRLWRAPSTELAAMVNDQLATRLAVELCPEGGVFVDVGAHIGSIISDVQHRRKSTRIVAFEAVPEKAEALVRRFPNVEVHNVALWDRDGEVSFFVHPVHSSCSSLHRSKAEATEIKIPARRLDAVIREGEVDVIKIDVEGAELGVLRGAIALLSRARPIVMFESGPEDRCGFTKADMFGFFAEQGYALFVPNRIGHTGDALTLDGFLDSHEFPRRTTNYFALPKERVPAIRSVARSL